MSVTVLNMHHLPNKQLPPGDSSYVYIGRPRGNAPLGLGNPFKVGEGYQRGEAVDAFKGYAQDEWKNPNSELRKQVTALAERVYRGEDIKLVCWCKPKSCHGDIIKGAIDTLVTRWQARAAAEPGAPAQGATPDLVPSSPASTSPSSSTPTSRVRP
jgi:hypothetical protein